MNYTFLRGIDKAAYKDTDMWLNLFTKIVGNNDTGEMLCFGEPYFKQISHNFIIRTVPSIDDYCNNPDVIFVRGRFKQWIKYLKKNKSIKKIYYGAGNSGISPDNTIHYDIILYDCENQLERIKKDHPNTKCIPWTKPAHEIFKPPLKYTYEYDICFIANGGKNRDHKGHSFIKNTCPDNLKILHLGIESEIDKLDNVTHILAEHNQVPQLIGKCKIGIVPYSNRDSCPRVIPEMLACGIPIVVSNTTNFWHNLYKGTVVSDYDSFWENVNNININNKEIAEYYNNNLSIDCVSKRIKQLCVE